MIGLGMCSSLKQDQGVSVMKFSLRAQSGDQRSMPKCPLRMVLNQPRPVMLRPPKCEG